MLSFTAEELAKAADELDMVYPAHVLDQLVAAIDAGKHVVLTGPPGTGKTTLAYLAAEVGAAGACSAPATCPTTATTEWTTFETIGGFQPTAEGFIYRPGLFVEAIESRPLARDRRAQPVELRPRLRPAVHRAVRPAGRAAVQARRPGQAAVDRAPRRRAAPRHRADPGAAPLAHHRHHERVRQEPAVRDVVRAHAAVRVHRGHLADRGRLPAAARGPGAVVRQLLPLRAHRDLGPAVYLDAAKFAARRAARQPDRVAPALRDLLRVLPARSSRAWTTPAPPRCTARSPRCSTRPSSRRRSARSWRFSAST